MTYEQPSMDNKPKGLWYSLNNKWFSFMLNNDLNLSKKSIMIYKIENDFTENIFDPAPYKILSIDALDLDKIKQFCNIYMREIRTIFLDTIDDVKYIFDLEYRNKKINEIRCFKYGRKNTDNIGWTDVASNFAGIEIINHPRPILRNNFLGWDVDGECIWRHFHIKKKFN